jgi:hypothetical protein
VREHAIHVCKHFVVPDSNDGEALFFEPAIPLVVGRLGCMMTAIQLDHESMLEANEVDDVMADRILALEFASVQPTAPQAVPERAFGIRRLLAELFCKRAEIHGVLALFR